MHFLLAPLPGYFIYMESKISVKKNGFKHPEVRSLKIQPKIRNNRWVNNVSPEIKLCGNWLQELGFNYGRRVVVTTMKELLIISLLPD
jgi:toxic protein SymE